MELRDIYYLLSGFILLVGGIISLVGVSFKLQTRIELLNQDLSNVKERAKEDELRYQDHKDKIEDKLESISGKIAEIREMLAQKK